MSYLWNTFIYDPIYNALIASAQYLTLKDVGLAVVLVTIVVRLILFPISKKSVISQYKMRLLEPKLRAIKEQKLSKEEEARQTFELYKTEKINPFSGCLFVLIQIPILFALYFAFMKGVHQPEHLYGFLSAEGLSNVFLGLIDITKPFLPFAILAGVTQAIQAFLMPKPVTSGEGFQASFAKSMSVQTRYVLPIIIILVASKFAAAVSIYWSVTNFFSIGQELYIRKTLKPKTV